VIAGAELKPKVGPNRELRYVSPSQLKTFRDCPRKWYFEAVVGLRSQEQEHHRTGKKIHAQLERWYRDGVEPTYASAQLSLQHLPPRGPELLIEYPMGDATLEYAPQDRASEFKMGAVGPTLTLAGVPVVGWLDLLDPRGAPAELLVLDHKSSKDMKWALHERQLEYDPQLVIYGAWAAMRFPEAHGVRFAHNVISTRSKDTRAIQSPTITHVDDIAKRCYELTSEVEQMAGAALKPDPWTVEPNKAACAKYGGCPWVELCYSEERTMAAMDLGAMLKAQAAGAAVQPSIVPPDAPPAVLAPAVEQPRAEANGTRGDIARAVLPTVLQAALVTKEPAEVSATDVADLAFRIADAMLKREQQP
jgi:CRISPR/Cas system-associated exonuclease Cas4 (RecB family)